MHKKILFGIAALLLLMLLVYNQSTLVWEDNPMASDEKTLQERLPKKGVPKKGVNGFNTSKKNKSLSETSQLKGTDLQSVGLDSLSVNEANKKSQYGKDQIKDPILQEQQPDFENPDTFATDLEHPLDNKVISIGEYIPVPDGSGSEEVIISSDSEKVVEIGEYIPIDEEALQTSLKEYEEAKSLGLIDESEVVEPPLIPPVVTGQEGLLQESKVVEIGEYIPVDVPDFDQP